MLDRRRALRLAAAGSLVPGSALARPEPPPRPRIMMLLWRGWEAVCAGFRDQLTDSGVPADLIVLDAGQDLSRIPGFVAQAKAIKPDLVFLWGTTVTVAALGPWDAVDPARHLADAVPALFTLVAEPVATRIVRDLAHPGRRVTGTLHLAPIAQQLALIASYRPCRRLGVIWSPVEQGAIGTLAQLRLATAADGIALIERPVSLDGQGRPRADLLPVLVRELALAGADWLYLPPDSFLVVHSRALTEAAIADIRTWAAAWGRLRCR